MAKVHFNKVSPGNSKHQVVIQAKQFLDKLMSNDKNKSYAQSIERGLFSSFKK